jgi:hypothetical protein
MRTYTVGIEEEYFISHAQTFAAATRVSNALARALCRAAGSLLGWCREAGGGEFSHQE